MLRSAECGLLTDSPRLTYSGRGVFQVCYFVYEKLSDPQKWRSKLAK